MGNMLEPYSCQFNEDERKRMIAQILAQLRKSKKLSQKEVAAAIGVSQATYSTYERGRTEPSAESMVRLSYLFNVPVDFIVQRDRLYRNAEDLQKLVDGFFQQINEMDSAMTENGGDNETVKAFVGVMEQLAGALKGMSQRADLSQQLDEVLD